jgi:nucleoside-diphosphate-sugar epimerase
MSVVSSGRSPFVLVTGSTGFLGSRLVEAFVQNGYRVRAFARKTSNTEQLKRLNIDIFYGDVADYASLEPAFKDINFVVHAAADTKADNIESLRTTADGTRNIVELSKKYEIKKLIYISSCSVYGVSEFTRDQVIREDAPLEKHPERRGFYSEAKLMAEMLLIDSATKKNIPFVCLRPGTIFGEKGEIYTSMMGFSLGKRLFIIIDNGNFILPLVYIDNLVEAIFLAMSSSNSAGQIYNVVDYDRITKREYVDVLLRKLYPNAVFLYVPYVVLHAMVHLQEMLFTFMRRKAFLTRYRLVSSQQSIIYDASKIRKELGWNPATNLRDAIEKVIAYEKNKANIGLHSA